MFLVPHAQHEQSSADSEIGASIISADHLLSGGVAEIKAQFINGILVKRTSLSRRISYRPLMSRQGVMV